MPAECSGTPLPKKLGIKEGTRFAVKGAPTDFADTLGELSAAVELRKQVRPGLDVLVAFYTSQSKMVTDWLKQASKVCAIDETCGGLRFALRRE